MLRALISRAAQSSACQPSTAKDSRGTTSGGATSRSNSGHAVGTSKSPRQATAARSPCVDSFLWQYTLLMSHTSSVRHVSGLVVHQSRIFTSQSDGNVGREGFHPVAFFTYIDQEELRNQECRRPL